MPYTGPKAFMLKPDQTELAFWFGMAGAMLGHERAIPLNGDHVSFRGSPQGGGTG